MRTYPFPGKRMFILPDGIDLPSEQEERFIAAVARHAFGPVLVPDNGSAHDAPPEERLSFVRWVYLQAFVREDHLRSQRSGVTPSSELAPDVAVLPEYVANHCPGLLAALWGHLDMVEPFDEYVLTDFCWEVAGRMEMWLITEESGERTVRKG